MKSPEKSVNSSESSEQSKEGVKKEILQEVEKRLDEVNIGAYTADKEYGGGVSTDIFDCPKNVDEVLAEMGRLIDLAISESWAKEKLEETFR